MTTTPPWLHALTAPESIMLVGASSDPSRVAGRALTFLQRYGYAGGILPVNRRASEVQGVPAFATVEDVPGSPDLAVISVPSHHVSAQLQACVDKGVKTVIVYASGYAEQDERGAQQQAELAAIVRGTGTRVLGPNCLGAVTPATNVVATFATAFDSGELSRGDIGLVTQSGAFASFAFGLVRNAGLGFGFVCTTGNEMDLTLGEVIDGVVELPGINSLLLHAEEIRDIEAFRKAAEKARRLDKPIAVVKVGRSNEGARAARAHTNAVVGDDAAYSSLFDELGVVRVESISEMADAARVFHSRAKSAGNRVAIVSISGGTGVLMADVAIAEGLEVPALSDEVRARLSTAIPPFGSTRNPVDMTGGILDTLENFEFIIRECAADPGIDIVVVALGNAAANEQQLVASIGSAATAVDKPVFAAWVGGSESATGALNALGVPTFDDPNKVIRAAVFATRAAGGARIARTREGALT